MKIGITLGDPLGIGPEVVVKALADPKLAGRVRFVLYGSPIVLQAAMELVGVKKFSPNIILVDSLSLQRRGLGRGPAARTSPNPLLCKEGDKKKQAGHLAISSVRLATEAALRGDIAAIVTAPLNKHHAHLAGFKFPGHTEYLAALTGTKTYRMMMAGPTLKVTLATIHEPLAKVPGLLTIQNLLETITLTHRELRRLFKIKKPKIAVAGLNPHAGEEGLFGQEERKIITPAVRKARQQNIRVEGPFPPDTIFRRVVAGEFDAIIALYHDQGLIPLKLLHFAEAVNITLGLPIIRTSVDHGTAEDIAWQGIADPTNMKAAINMAINLAL